jgi:predicted transcriptional regulator
MDAEPKLRTQTAVAKLLGVTQPAVSSWLRGVSRPEPMYRDALQGLAGIPQDSWELASERKRRELMRRRIDGVSTNETPSPVAS